jgi:hypothetical protein
MLLVLEVEHVCDADVLAIAAAPQAAQLTTLRISRAGAIRRAGLTAIVRSFPALRELSVSELAVGVSAAAGLSWRDIATTFDDECRLGSVSALELRVTAGASSSDDGTFDGLLPRFTGACACLTRLSLTGAAFANAGAAFEAEGAQLQSLEHLALTPEHHPAAYKAANKERVLGDALRIVRALPKLRLLAGFAFLLGERGAGIVEQAMQTATGATACAVADV